VAAVAASSCWPTPRVPCFCIPSQACCRKLLLWSPMLSCRGAATRRLDSHTTTPNVAPFDHSPSTTCLHLTACALPVLLLTSLLFPPLCHRRAGPC
jgi:hypothetical protein